jgi:hypothetical protein
MENQKDFVILDHNFCPVCEDVLTERRNTAKYQHYILCLKLRKPTPPYPLCQRCFGRFDYNCRNCYIPLSDVHYLQDSSVTRHHPENFDHCFDCWELEKSRERTIKDSYRVDRSLCPGCGCALGTPETPYELKAHQKSSKPWPMCKTCLESWREKAQCCKTCKMPVTESPILQVGTAAMVMYGKQCSWCENLPQKKRK